MKKRVGSVYQFHRCGMDAIMSEHCPDIDNGQLVRVVRLPHAPKPGTMNQYHIEDAQTKVFLGMCYGTSLKPR